LSNLSANTLHATEPKGLTSAEAAARLRQYGPNIVPERRPNRLLVFLSKFWAPVPWMLEATVILELALRKYDEAIIIGLLLVFNSILSFVQESQSNHALALLRNRLAVHARVLRDGAWQLLSASDLVPGDVARLRMGDIAPADLRLLDGELLLDQSALTGESLPVEARAGDSIYAGATVKRGEANAEVTATGTRTYFGKTAELVGAAKTVSHLQEVIFAIVKYMVLVDVALVIALFIYALFAGLPFSQLVPFALILLVASVPVALPATFTVATALGALELAKRGVLITRLSAIEEAAAMDILCSDKTGTITQNRLALADLHPYAPHTDDEILRLAALASDEATQDPIDLAILTAARERNLLTSAARTRFVPFDPQSKRSEAVVQQDGRTLRIVKGAPYVIASLATDPPDWNADLERLAASGYRILAVASGSENDLRLAGLLALADPPREDSAALVQNLRELGVRVVMVTGDGPATARAVAAQVGIGNRGCPPQVLRGAEICDAVRKCDVIASVFPEDKFRLVQAFQDLGRVTGMTGDGVNDAPALKQAEVGIAVSNATDVAKAAASMVLLDPGLSDVVGAVESSRRIYQRMLTYTLNKVIKTVQIGVFLSLGVMLTGSFVITPLLIVLLLFTNDFVTMSIATDRVSFSKTPDRWRVRTLMLTGGSVALMTLVLLFSVFYAGRDLLHLALPQLQTLVFLMLVFNGQANVYLVRERRHFWQSRPSRWLTISSIGDVLVVSFLAWRGILMTPVAPVLIAAVFLLTFLFMFPVDYVKIRIFRWFNLQPS
jgi:H+-transporting ATPase